MLCRIGQMFCGVWFPFLLSPAFSALQWQLISLRLKSLALSSDILPHLVTGSGCAIRSILLNGVPPPPSPTPGCCRVAFLKVSIKRHNRYIQIILQWFLHSFLPALDRSAIPLPVAHYFCAICISLTNAIHSATPFRPSFSTFSAINILAR